MAFEDTINDYFRQRYHEFHRKLIDLHGGKCVRCGSIVSLEFDHIDPSTKVCDVTSLLRSSFAASAKEAEKCQLLCRPCHAEKTIEDLGPLAKNAHGTPFAYKYCGPPKCDPCTVAWRHYLLAYMHKRREDSREGKSNIEIKHGTKYGYQFCGPPRCQPCKDAKNTAERVRRAGKRAEKLAAIAALQNEKKST